MAEECGVCGDRVPFDATVHLLVHPAEGEVTDYYVCENCYDAELAVLLD